MARKPNREKVMYDPYNFAAVAERFKAEQEAEKLKERTARGVATRKQNRLKKQKEQLKKVSKKLEKSTVTGPLGGKVKVKTLKKITGGAPGLDKGIRSKMYIGKKFSNGGSMKNKSKGKVVKYTGKHKLDKYLTRDQIKQLDPFGVDILLQVQEGANKPKKKKMGGVMKNRGGTFKGVY
jgi:hypothetical protein